MPPSPGSHAHQAGLPPAMPPPKNVPVTLDTLIAVRILFQGQSRRSTLPLGDLGLHTLPGQVCNVLDLPADAAATMRLERFSDSAACYVLLDTVPAYKSLFRAAKAKLKLRLRVTTSSADPAPKEAAHPDGHVATPRSPAPSQPKQTNAQEVRSLVERVERLHKRALANEVERQAHREHQDSAETAPSMMSTSGKPADATGIVVSQSQNVPGDGGSWVVSCNKCGRNMPHEHYHCSICEGGDYDLCRACVDAGAHCPGAQHWMVKRWVHAGTVINSTTERIEPKNQATKDMLGAFNDVVDAPRTEPAPPAASCHEDLAESTELTRTCNCCVTSLPEADFITCTDCEDYDLCLPCFSDKKHGHHPGHVMKPVESSSMDLHALSLFDEASRGVRHAAYCDGCDQVIYGTRHKCVECPDWDFCSHCIETAKTTHARHRFVPIYKPLAAASSPRTLHTGIHCDGPLCKERHFEYIRGIRYKCAICHDIDFCAACEASPSNMHNRTHPKIKFETPVRAVSVTTTGNDRHGVPLAKMGDRYSCRSAATETTPAPASGHAATQTPSLERMCSIHQTKQASLDAKPSSHQADHVSGASGQAAAAAGPGKPVLGAPVSIENAPTSTSSENVRSTEQPCDGSQKNAPVVACEAAQIIEMLNKRSTKRRKERAACAVRDEKQGDKAAAKTAALQDYELQLMLLEQQKKKREQLAFLESARASAMSSQERPSELHAERGERSEAPDQGPRSERPPRKELANKIRELAQVTDHWRKEAQMSSGAAENKGQMEMAKIETTVPSHSASLRPKEQIANQTQTSEVTVQPRGATAARPRSWAPPQWQKDASPMLDAVFVEDMVPDKHSVPPNSVFVQCWTLRNVGATVWPAGCSVRFVGGDNMLNVDNTKPASFGEVSQASSSSVQSHPVAIGALAHFRVLLKAPSREGPAVSYWRLKDVQTGSFGPKLWCGITVERGATASCSSTLLPTGTSSSTEPQAPASLAPEDGCGQTSSRATSDAEPVEDKAALQGAVAQSDEGVETHPGEKQGMIFPKLEKESPAASTHESSQASQLTELASPTPSSVPAEDGSTTSATLDDSSDALETADSIDAEAWSEASFATDEEYDILDASDTETV